MPHDPVASHSCRGRTPASVQLDVQLGGGLHVAQGAEPGGPAAMHAVRRRTLVAQATADLVDAAIGRGPVGIPGEVQPRAGELGERVVAHGSTRGRVAEAHEGRVEAPGAGGERGEHRPVALRAAGGDEVVAALGQRVGEQELQAAHLVAAEPEPRQVVALEPDLDAEPFGEPRREVQRRGERRQGDACDLVEAGHHVAAVCGASTRSTNAPVAPSAPRGSSAAASSSSDRESGPTSPASRSAVARSTPLSTPAIVAA